MCNCSTGIASAWNQTTIQDSPTCDITVAMLQEWKRVFEYAQGRNLVEHTGYNRKTFFSLYGCLLTALSYQGDYCELSCLQTIRNNISTIKTRIAYDGNH